AAGMMVANCRIRISSVTTTLFTKYLRNGPEFHASTKFCHCKASGIQTGGNVMVSPSDLKAVLAIHTNGTAKMMNNRTNPIPLAILKMGDEFICSPSLIGNVLACSTL